jgi:hypothetical protein
MTEVIRELDAGELELVSGSGVYGAIVSELAKVVMGGACGLAGELIGAATGFASGGPVGAAVGAIGGAVAGAVLADSLGLD